MKANLCTMSLTAIVLLGAAASLGDEMEIKTYLDPSNPYWWSYYEREDGTRVICGVKLPNREQWVKIPDMDGTVREIAPYAFTNAPYMKSVWFPDCITNIGDYAFFGSGTIIVRNLPANLTGIGKGAFMNVPIRNNCPEIPAGVERIEDYTFAGCEIWSENLKLPEGLKHIGDYGLNFEWHAESLTFPDCVTNIGSGVFKGVSELRSLHLPAGLVNLGGEETFSGCSRLTDITLPHGMKHIGTQMFYNCSSLTNITISGTVESIGYQAFYGCANLTSLALPDSLTNIAAKAFYACTFRELTIPPNMVSLESESLTEIFRRTVNGTTIELVGTLELLRLPRQFEGRLDEFAPFGRNSKGKAAIPYNLEIVYYGPYNLAVASAYGTPSPAGSVNHLEAGTVMECTVSPAEIVTATARHRCTGWTGAGDVPASGAGTAVSFTATEQNSRLTWNWASEYRVSCTVSGAAETIVASDWIAEGGTYDVAFAPTVERFRVTLGGDAEDVVVDEAARCVHIPADRARQVSVEIVPALWTLTTAVPVPYEWLDGYPNLLAAYGEDYEAFANAAAVNRRKVWECYALGLTPETPEDFRITSFRMKADGTPDIAFSPPRSQWNVSDAEPKVQGAATPSGPWLDVPEGGDRSLRFFRVAVTIP